MTGIASYKELSVPHPVFVAVDHAGPQLAWLKPIVNIGAMVGLASAILVTLYGQIRIFYSMSRDGFIWPVFSKLHPRFCIPLSGTWICGISRRADRRPVPDRDPRRAGLDRDAARFRDGLRRRRGAAADDAEHAKRVFRVPFGVPVAIFGVLCCVRLMLSLPWDTWDAAGRLDGARLRDLLRVRLPALGPAPHGARN